MADGAMRLADEARRQAHSMPLDEVHPGDPKLFRTNTHWPYFERLRAEDPGNYTPDIEVKGYETLPVRIVA